MASANNRKFEVKLGRTGLLILIAGMTALLCVSFLLGVGVGKNIDTYPGKIASLPQKILSQVWRPSTTKSSSPVLESKTEQNQIKEEELDLTFYNTLTSKKGIVDGKSSSEKKKSSESPEVKQDASLPRGEPSSLPKTVKKETENPQEAKEASPAQDVIAAKIREAEEAMPPRGKYSIQVASLKEKNKAQQMTKKLSSLGYASRIVENNVPGKGKWFRVVVEGFDSKASAKSVAENIADKLGVACMVRRVDAPESNDRQTD